MMHVDLSRHAEKEYRSLPAKIQRQISSTIARLAEHGKNCHDLKLLKGPGRFSRIDSGEYRIVVRFEDDIIKIYLIGKRNDDEIYKRLKRLLN